MKSPAIEHLLSSLGRWRFGRLLLQISLLAAGSFLFSRIALSLAERYGLDVRWILLPLIGPVVLVLAARAILNFRSNTRARLARELDDSYLLKDRLSTYVQLKNSEHPFLEPIIHETEAHIQGLSVLRCASFLDGTKAPLCFAILPALALVALPFLPASQSVADRIDQHHRIVQEAKKLQTEAKKLESNPDPDLKKLAGELDQLAKELEKPTTPAAEALKKMNAMQDRLEDAQKQADKSKRDALTEELNKLAKEGKKSGDLSDDQKKQIQEAAKELEKMLADKDFQSGKEMQQALKDGKLSREQMEKMKKSIEDYKSRQEETEKRMAELQKSLESAKKSTSAGKHQVVYNSKLDDRKVETGKSGVDDGPGTTNKDVGPQKFDTHKQGKGEYAEDKTKAEYEQIYKGQREKAGSDPLFLNGQWDPENARYTKIRTFGLNSDTETSGGVQENVLQNDAESVIHKEKVPASYRNLVKKYFESIQQ